MTNEEYEKVIADLKCEADAMRKRAQEEFYRAEKLKEQLSSAALPLRYDTYGVAVSVYGKPSQLIMAMEEMSELTKELSKNMRGAMNVRAISEEIADVEIMLEQLKIIFANRAEVDRQKSEKLKRLSDRLVHDMA